MTEEARGLFTVFYLFSTGEDLGSSRFAAAKANISAVRHPVPRGQCGMIASHGEKACEAFLVG